MSRVRRSRFATFAVAAAMVLAACGSSDGGTAGPAATEASSATDAAPTTEDPGLGGDETVDEGLGGDDEQVATDDTTADTTADTTSEEAVVDPCAGVELEQTEIGVSADEITLVVMADTGSELAPGLFQGSIDGAKAWADHVNSEGGLGCRQINLIEWDSKVHPTETTNGFLTACDQALGMVGSSSLFVTDVTALETCPDLAGNPTGVPDVAERTVETGHDCSPNSFSTSVRFAECPHSGTGERHYYIQTGMDVWLRDNVLPADPTGLFIIPGDLPSLITVGTYMSLGAAGQGIGVDLVAKMSGRDTQEAYGALVQGVKDSGTDYVLNNSADTAMISMRAEAAAQGLDPSTVTWACQLACYTEQFQAASDVDGTYMQMSFLPYEEADTNEELATFLEAMDQPHPDAWAAGAWAAGVLYEDVINAIVEADGPNAITRERVLAELKATDDFDANGWFGSLDYTGDHDAGDCFVLLQLNDGAFERVYPAERGTLSCEPSNIYEYDLDTATALDS